MATASDSVGTAVDPHRCENAAEFIRRRLAGADEPRSPSGLASEYGCQPNWMRQEMSRMAREGEIERVSRGKYVDARDGQDETTDEDISVLDGSAGVAELGDVVEQDEGTDDNEDDTMPTAEEYEQQLADRADGTDADEDESTGSDNGDEADRTEKQAEGTDAGEGEPTGSLNPSAVLGGVDPRTLMMVVAVVAVGYVLVSSLSGGDQDGADGAEEQVEESSGDDWPGGWSE